MFGKFKGWFTALSSIGRVGFIVTVVAVGLIANAASHPTPPPKASETPPTVQGESTETKPKVEKKTEYTTESIPFESQTVDDSTLTAGVDQVRAEGANGVRTKTWDVTYTDGKETGRVPVNDGITTAPITKITAHGTYIAPPPPIKKCDSNYSGCVPIASDVDCAGGGGNGPAYVAGPVYVTGSDIYGLDRDGDGIACE